MPSVLAQTYVDVTQPDGSQVSMPLDEALQTPGDQIVFDNSTAPPPMEFADQVYMNGEVAGLYPDYVRLDVDDRDLLLPLGMVSFEEDGYPVEPSGLSVGTAVTVVINPFNGDLLGLGGGILSLYTPAGEVDLPDLLVPPAYPMGLTPVPVLLDNGEVSLEPFYDADDLVALPGYYGDIVPPAPLGFNLHARWWWTAWRSRSPARRWR